MLIGVMELMLLFDTVTVCWRNTICRVSAEVSDLNKHNITVHWVLKGFVVRPHTRFPFTSQLTKRVILKSRAAQEIIEQ